MLGGRSRYADPTFLRRFAKLATTTVARGDWAALAAEIATTGLLRNSSTIAVPPTGRSAPVVGASTGIEPLFRLSHDRIGHHRPAVVAALQRAGRTDVLGFVSTNGRLPCPEPDLQHVRAVLATATQISPAGHLAAAAARQACVDEAVSTEPSNLARRPLDRGLRHLRDRVGAGVQRHYRLRRRIPRHPAPSPRHRKLRRESTCPARSTCSTPGTTATPSPCMFFLVQQGKVAADAAGREWLRRQAASACRPGTSTSSEDPDCIGRAGDGRGTRHHPPTRTSCGRRARCSARSLEPRVDIFFTAAEWTGTPEMRRPHK